VGPANGGTLVGRKLGDYQLQALLGAGGMAEVYRALELPLGREVAVKVLPAALAADPNYVARFRTEARRVAQLRHPNIVEVYAFNGGEHGGLLYLVMPVLRESLRDLLDQEGRLPITEAIRIVTEIASGLDMAHSIGLVHRDVKPENILLDKDGQAQLTDFGIAREVPIHRQGNAAQTLAATGLPVGTPEYMAPEQLRGGLVDQRADVYALGSVLYESLTGRVPHEADTPYEVAALVLTEPVMPPSRINEQISAELEQVVLTALAKHPEERYPDMRSFALALNSAARSRRTTMRTLAGGWQRKTARFSVTGLPGLRNTAADYPLGFSGDGTAATIPAIAKPAAPRSLAGYRLVLAIVAGAILLASLCGGGTLFALNGFPFGNASPASVTGPSATQTARAIAAAAATATPTATPEPTATPIPTATVPPPLSVYLTFTPSPLVLVRTSFSCSGTMTITNKSPGKLGWQWVSASGSLSGYTFTMNGKTTSSLPQNMSPGLSSQASDTVLVRVSSCSNHQASVTITAKDSLGHTYKFVIKPT
jgi:eukaryotic-like serine/threonine-protein kinase